MIQKLITVAQARTVLGKRAQQMTDKQIHDLLQLLRVVCDKSIESTVQDKISASYEK